MGKFPAVLKGAVLRPLLKKANLTLTLLNYHPVSNLSFLSKVIERCVCPQLVSFSKSSNNMEPLQSAYRTNHSTETALLKVQTDILDAIDNKSVMCLVLLDLSAAFNTVNHSILLNRLKYHFGLGGKILQWIEDYLIGCTQRVIIDNDGEGEPRAESSKTTLSQGVPQGSVLGPVLFLLYTAPLGDICHRHRILFHSYADDQQTYLSFKPSVENSRETCITNLQNCIDEIRSWMRVNLLKLNDSKTEFIILGTQQQLNNVPYTTIKIGEDHINPSSSVRNLGFY